MKNTIKAIGIICIIALTTFIVACGPGAEPEPKASKNSDGSWTIEEGATVPSKPSDPTEKDGIPLTDLSDVGLFKNFAGYNFEGWFVGDDQFDGWGKPATSAVTVVPKFTIKSPGQKVTLSGTDDVVFEAFNYLNGASTSL